MYMKKVRQLKLDKSAAINMYTFLTQFHELSDEHARRLNHLDLRDLGFITVSTKDINKEDILTGTILLVRDKRKKYEIYPNPLRLKPQDIINRTEVVQALETPKQKTLGVLKQTL